MRRVNGLREWAARGRGCLLECFVGERLVQLANVRPHPIAGARNLGDGWRGDVARRADMECS